MGDTAFDSKPIIFSNVDTTAVVVAAPLFYMNTADAKNLVKNILALFGDLSNVCIDMTNNAFSASVISSNFKSINIMFENKIGEDVEISLIDVSGRIIEKTFVKISSQTQKMTIGKNILPGIYFIDLKTEKDVLRKKIIILK